MTPRPAGIVRPFLTRPAARAPLGLLALLLPMLLTACGGDDLPGANRTDPVKVQGTPVRDTAETPAGTPMAERVAVLGLLNKRNGLTRDLTMKPGEALRAGDAIVRLQACETTAPWENVQETGAFVQLDVRSTADGKWRRNFSGWLFRERPDRNVVQHPIYDVWVKSCTMEWPETGPETVKLGPRGEPAVPAAAVANGANARSAAAPDPAASPPPAAPNAAPNAAPSTAAPSN